MPFYLVSNVAGVPLYVNARNRSDVAERLRAKRLPAVPDILEISEDEYRKAIAESIKDSRDYRRASPRLSFIVSLTDTAEPWIRDRQQKIEATDEASARLIASKPPLYLRNKRENEWRKAWLTQSTVKPVN